MANLFIYCDESGTMPYEKESDIFLVASVAIFGKPPVNIQKSGHKNWLVQQLIGNKAIPFIAYINPTPENKIKIKVQLEKIDIMARITRLMTGANSQFLTPDGIAKRNFIWIFCLVHSVGNVILNAASLHSIDKIDLIFDQKSMAPPSIRYLKNQLSHQLITMKNSIRKSISQVSPQLVDYLLNNISTTTEIIDFKWSNEIEMNIHETGLNFAHYLAYHFRNDFGRNTNNNFMSLLKSSGYGYFETEISHLLTRSLNQKTIDDWELNTGLKV